MPKPTRIGEVDPTRKPNGVRRRASAARTLQRFRRWRHAGLVARLAVIAVVAVPCLVVSSPQFVAYASQLPDTSKLAGDVRGDTMIYADDGSTLLADLHPPGYQQYHEPLSAMGTNLPDAIIAIEDRNFYQEPGIDVGAIARAAVVDLRARDNIEGASTITQQLVKIRLVGNAPTFQRKAIEAVLAFDVERRYSKSQILEMYLNSASFGNGAVGTAAASQIYFHKSTHELDLAESSMLAGLVRGPTLYSPFANWPAAKARQREVLDAMVAAGKITSTSAAKAFTEDLKPPNHMFTPSSAVIATGFVSYVTDQLIRRYGRETTFTGGLRVQTTLDPKLQAIGQEAISGTQQSLAWRHVQQGAMVAIDPRSGAIMAMVSSANPTVNGGQYNLAVWPPRNPGSSMKIFTYTTAIASGRYTMTSSIADGPFRYIDPGSGLPYQPQNYDGKYHGTCQLQVCMGSSLNIPAVKVELGVGVANVVQTARAMGAPPWQHHEDGSFTNNDPLDSYGPSLTLGGYGETPLQMATGASVLAAQGVLHQPFAIGRVEQQGRVLYEHEDSARQVVDPRVAFITSTMMSKDSNRSITFGTGSQLVVPGWSVGVKTGTSDSFADAWTVGFTPRIAVAVWMGNPDWRIKMTEGSDSYYVAVPAWHAFLDQALPVLGPNAWYSPPAGLVYAWGNYYLPGTAPRTDPAPPPPVIHMPRKRKHKH